MQVSLDSCSDYPLNKFDSATLRGNSCYHSIKADNFKMYWGMTSLLDFPPAALVTFACRRIHFFVFYFVATFTLRESALSIQCNIVCTRYVFYKYLFSVSDVLLK